MKWYIQMVYSSSLPCLMALPISPVNPFPVITNSMVKYKGKHKGKRRIHRCNFRKPFNLSCYFFSLHNFILFYSFFIQELNKCCVYFMNGRVCEIYLNFHVVKDILGKSSWIRGDAMILQNVTAKSLLEARKRH